MRPADTETAFPIPPKRFCFVKIYIFPTINVYFALTYCGNCCIIYILIILKIVYIL